MVGLVGIHPDTLAAISAGYFYPVTLVFVDWPGDPVRVHSGLGDIEWAEQTWRGIGGFDGGLILPGDSAGLARETGAMTLGGLPADFVAHLEADPIGRTVLVFGGAVTERAGNVLIGNPFESFAGEVTGVSDSQTQDRRTLSVQIASGPSQRATASTVHSYEDQIRNHPTDTAGRLLWAAMTAATANLPRW